MKSDQLYKESERLYAAADKAALKEARQDLSGRLGDLRKRLLKLDRSALSGLEKRLYEIETWLNTREDL